MIGSKPLKLNEFSSEKKLFVPHVPDPAWQEIGTVLFQDLKPRSCKYTPTEKPPFFFCGEPLDTDHPSWCRRCQGIVFEEEECDE